MTTLRPVLLLVKYYDYGISPLLRYTPASPYGDHIGAELLQHLAVTAANLIQAEFKQFGRKLIGCNS